MTVVEVWSDIACPWCYIGKRRLERALESVADPGEVEVTWRAFQLAPDAPRFGQPGAGEPTLPLLARKYGVTVDEARAMQERVTAVAAEDGLAYHLERGRHVNTFDAHRLVLAAREHDAGDALLERLFDAQHVAGERVDDPEVLVRLADAAGLPAERAAEVLESNQYADAVTADLRTAAELGIRGVPFFVFDRRYGLSGAHPATAIVAAIERARADREPAPAEPA